ncbi:MAG: sugar ABC transporter substrate-binding protein [Solirubrobacteraceae bacterium]
MSVTTAKATGVSAQSVNMTAAEAQLKEALAAKQFAPQGGAYSIAALKNKPVWALACGGGNLFCQKVTEGASAAAHAAGVPFKSFVVAEPTKDAAALETAIAGGARAVLLIGVAPEGIQKPLAAAREKGVKIINVVGRSLKAGLAPQTDANVTNDFSYEGEVAADYAVVHEGAKTNAVCGRVPVYPTTANVCSGFKQRLATLCAGCAYKEVNFNVTALAQEVPAGIDSTIHSDPKFNFLMCSIDEVCQNAIPAIKAAGKSGEIIAGAQTGSITPNLKWVSEGNVQQEDAGVPELWVGWAATDEAMRLMANSKSAPTEVGVPEHFFTTESLKSRRSLNYSADNSDEVYETEKGAVYEKAFEKDWLR